MTASEFAETSNVSRETLNRLETYLSLITHWQNAINLVGPKTLADPWRRHFLDSAQLIDHISLNTDPVYDLGSGAGLPGIVLAILGKSNIHLVESDQRKAQFLNEVSRVLGLDATIHTQRIETLPKNCATIVTARALAPLPRLIKLAFPLLRTNSHCLFLKGQSVSDELTEACKCWRMTIDLVPSRSDPSASILKLRDIVRAPLHRE
ncbi:MAG: 16S rRNA (guanine(527)-N(7))-methyltransferase RsmG [Geminicoccaceae bacterium]